MLLRPDTFKAYFCISVPCYDKCPRVNPAHTETPLEAAKRNYKFGEADSVYWYLLFHNNLYTDIHGFPPESDYETDLAVTFRKTFQNWANLSEDDVSEPPVGGLPVKRNAGKQTGSPSLGGHLARKGLPKALAPFTTEEDERYWIQQYSNSGFRGPLNLYRNVDANFHLFEQHLGKKIEQPVFFVGGGADSIISTSRWEGWISPASEGGDMGKPGPWEAEMRKVAPNLLDCRVIEGGCHWLTIEKAAEVNEHLGRFLASGAVREAIAGGAHCSRL